MGEEPDNPVSNYAYIFTLKSKLQKSIAILHFGAGNVTFLSQSAVNLSNNPASCPINIEKLLNSFLLRFGNLAEPWLAFTSPLLHWNVHHFILLSTT
jgi:hypothetical protein